MEKECRPLVVRRHYKTFCSVDSAPIEEVLEKYSSPPTSKNRKKYSFPGWEMLNSSVKIQIPCVTTHMLKDCCQATCFYHTVGEAHFHEKYIYILKSTNLFTYLKELGCTESWGS